GVAGRPVRILECAGENPALSVDIADARPQQGVVRASVGRPTDREGVYVLQGLLQRLVDRRAGWITKHVNLDRPEQQLRERVVLLAQGPQAVVVLERVAQRLAAPDLAANEGRGVAGRRRLRRFSRPGRRALGRGHRRGYAARCRGGRSRRAAGGDGWRWRHRTQDAVWTGVRRR